MVTARTLIIGLLVSAAMAPVAAHAAAPAGLAELLRQADFWKARGRGDLATQAYRRALAIDPANPVARRALQQGVSPAAAAASRAVPAAAAGRQAATAARAPVVADSGGPARAAGFAALERGDLATAAARFQTALKSRPNDADALGGLGIVRLRGKRFAEARDLLGRAARGGSPAKWSEALASARFFAELDAATKARDAGRLEEAETRVRKALTDEGGDTSAATALLADILGRQGRFAEAATLYANAAAGSGRNAGNVADLRGKAALAQARQAAASQDQAGADRAFRSAIANDPADPWARYEYARFLLAQNQPQAAAAAIQPLEQRVSPEAVYASALFWNQAGQPARADGLMGRIPANQRTAEMRSFLRETKINAAIAQARVLNAAGRTGEALAGLRMVANYPDLSVATLGSLADAFQTMGDPASAQALAQQALTLPAADPDSYASIVSLLAQNGQDGAAEALVQKMLAGSGGQVTPAIGKLNAGLVAAQADRLRLAGQNARAFDLLQSAWATAPNDRGILSALARLYQSGGMSQQALAVYDMLLRQTPNDVPALIGMADAAAGARDKARARGAAARAMQLQPANPDTYLAAARVEQALGDRTAALRYLKQARAIFGQKTMLAGGAAFPATNPFSNAGGGGPAASANPFALGRDEGGGMAATSPFQLMSAPYAAPQAMAGGAMPGGHPGASARHGRGRPEQYAMAEASPFGGPSANATANDSSAIADPTLRRINDEIEALTANSGPSVTASTSFRARSGEAGLSRLNEIGAKAEIGTSFGGDGRVSLSAAPVVLDSGGLSRSALARFGRNPTAEAVGIAAQLPSRLTAADTQHDTGVAFGASGRYGNLSADVGTTPVGFDKVDVQGSVSWSPKPSADTQVRVYAERRPVTDSVTSYAGTRDPVTGAYWGKVMRSGGGGSVSFDRNGNGVYADAAYRVYRGRSVRDNAAVEANVGGYLSVYRTDESKLTAGANLNYQSYDNDQNYFSFGHGGYFSPQSFVSLAFPVRYEGTFGDWDVTADASPGYQTYDQEGAAVYPTLPGEQAALDALKLVNADARSRYDSISKSGFGFAGGVGVTYRIGTATKVGGEMKYNTFGQYNEFQTNLKITQSIGGK